MGGLMYVRLGLANVRTVGFLKNAKYRTNWELKRMDEIKRWYGTIMGHIRTSKYGVYFALQELFGVDAANEVAANSNVIKPEGLQPALIVGPSQGGSLRRRDGNDDE